MADAGRLAAHLLARFPAATVTREGAGITIDLPAQEVTVRITAGSMEIGLYSVNWDSPHCPVPVTRWWKKTPLDARSLPELTRLVAAAARARRRQYHTCRFCGQSVPLEHRDSRDVCHSCAETHLGIVH